MSVNHRYKTDELLQSIKTCFSMTWVMHVLQSNHTNGVLHFKGVTSTCQW